MGTKMEEVKLLAGFTPNCFIMERGSNRWTQAGVLRLGRKSNVKIKKELPVFIGQL